MRGKIKKIKLVSSCNPGQVIMPIMGNDPDPAAIFACALSLWRECIRCSQFAQKADLSECCDGGGEFMRSIMRAGTRFEEWACAHIDFEEIDHCWPCLLEKRFGKACIALTGITSIDEFSEKDCLTVALRLKLAVKATGTLPVPVDLSADNLISGSEFKQFRIQTIREHADGTIEPFTFVDDPFDDKFGPPLFGYYGVCDDGTLEHIADFDSYANALGLARKLAPGIQFPDLAHAH